MPEVATRRDSVQAVVKTPRRILFAHWGEEGIRGSERMLLDLLAHLNRDRFTPIVWCNTESMAAAVRLLGLPAVVSRMPLLFDWDDTSLDIPGYLRLLIEGDRLVREQGVCLIHANSGASNQWMVPISRQRRIPLIGHLHAVYNLRDRCTMLLHQVPLLVGCSDSVVQPFRADGVPQDRLRVIHNGIDQARLNVGNATALRESLHLRDDAVLIAAAGALVPIKRFDVPIRALAMIRERGIDAHIVIVGDGPERLPLENLARRIGVSDQVHFLGRQPHVGAIFRDAADIVAVSSHLESFGLVVAEASAMGRPVVATRVGGIAEWARDGVTASLVPDNDPVAFADALSNLARNPERARQLGASAKAHVLGSFTVERQARSFEHLYDEMLTRSAASFGWSSLGFRMSPFARLGAAALRRHLNATYSTTS